MKKSNKLNILDGFEFLNIITDKKAETKPVNKPIVEKPKTTETIDDFLDDLLN